AIGRAGVLEAAVEGETRDRRLEWADAGLAEVRDLFVVALGEGRLIVPADAEVQSKPAADTPVVLHEGSCVDLLEGVGRRVVVGSRGEGAEKERGDWISGAGVRSDRCCDGVLLGEAAIEGEGAEAALRVLHVVADEVALKAKTDGMVAEGLGQYLFERAGGVFADLSGSSGREADVAVAGGE